MPATHDIEMTLDLDKSGTTNVAQAAVIRQGDVASTRLVLTIEDGGEAADLTGLSARIEATKPDGNPYQQACEVEGNVCTVTLDGQASAFPGRTLVCYVALYQGETFRGSTQDFAIQVLRAYDSGGGTSTPYSDALDETLAEYQERLEAMAAATEAVSAEAVRRAEEAIEARGAPITAARVHEITGMGV